MSGREERDTAIAKAHLEANGFVVVKAASYRRAQERQRVAEALRAAEVERREHTERWALDAFAEQRRLSDRLSFVYGVARAHGVTDQELAGDQDWTAAELGMELNALHRLYEQHGHGNWPDHYPTAWRLLAAFLTQQEAWQTLGPPSDGAP